MKRAIKKHKEPLDWNNNNKESIYHMRIVKQILLSLCCVLAFCSCQKKQKNYAGVIGVLMSMLVILSSKVNAITSAK